MPQTGQNLFVSFISLFFMLTSMVLNRKQQKDLTTLIIVQQKYVNKSRVGHAKNRRDVITKLRLKTIKMRRYIIHHAHLYFNI